MILQKAEAFEEGVAGGGDDDAQAHRPPEATRAEGDVDQVHAEGAGDEGGRQQQGGQDRQCTERPVGARGNARVDLFVEQPRAVGERAGVAVEILGRQRERGQMRRDRAALRRAAGRALGGTAAAVLARAMIAAREQTQSCGASRRRLIDEPDPARTVKPQSRPGVVFRAADMGGGWHRAKGLATAAMMVR